MAVAKSLWASIGLRGRPARVEVEQQRQVEKEKADPVEEKVVNKIVERTDLNAEQPPSTRS
jgi:hypothetical protein